MEIIVIIILFLIFLFLLGPGKPSWWPSLGGGWTFLFWLAILTLILTTFPFWIFLISVFVILWITESVKEKK